MRTTLPWRLLKFGFVSVLLVLSVQLFLSTVTRSKVPAERSLLPPEEQRLLSPLSYRFLLNQPHVCRDRSPFLLLLVPVAPREAAARQAVRETWASSASNTVTLFFMGLQPAEDQQGALQRESRKYGDLVQMDFEDSYQNLTVKTVMMMNWVSSFCPNASYAMKVDADIFLNVFFLLERLAGSPRTDFITGSVIWDGCPRRNPNSKWYLSEDQYPEDRFPPYVSGAGYVFSADLASRISLASRFVRAIPLEDVYVGLCLSFVKVRPVYSRDLLGFRNLFEIRHLEYDRCTFAKRVIVNGFEPAELRRIWKDFSRHRAEC